MKVVFRNIEKFELCHSCINPLSHSGHCGEQPSKISITVKEEIIKISYELRAYESVDDN